MNNEDEYKSSLTDKLIGAAMLVGTAAFIGSNTNALKNMSKAFNSGSKALSGFSDDIFKMSRKEATWDNISSSFKKSFSASDSVLSKTFNEGVSVSSTEGLLGAIKNFNSFKKSNGPMAGEFADNFQRDEVLKSFKTYFDDKDDTFMEQLQIFTTHVMDNKNQFYVNDFSGKTASISNSFSEALDGGILGSHAEEIESIMSLALKQAEETLSDVNEEFASVVKPQLEEEYKNMLKTKFKKKDEFFENTVSRALDVGEFLDKYDNGAIENTRSLDPIVTSLKELVREDDSFTQLVLDSASIRVDKATDEIFSLSPLTKAKDAMMDEFADTLFGKLFGVRSQILNKNVPDMFYIGKNSYDKVLSTIEGGTNGLLKSDYFKIGDRMFQYKDGALSHFEKGDSLEFIGAKHGNQAHLLNTLMGNTDYNIVDSKLMKELDIGTKGSNKLHDIEGTIGKFSKDSDWAPRVADRLLGNHYNKNDADNMSVLIDFNKDLRSINKLYNDQTFAPSKRVFEELKKIATTRTSGYLNAIDSDNIAGELLNSGIDLAEIKNKDLRSLLNKYVNNADVAKQSVHIGNLKGVGRGKNVLKYNDLVKREIAKEVMMTEGARNNNSFAAVKSKINTLDINNVDRKNLKDIHNWSIIQDHGDLFNSSAYKEKDLSKLRNSFLDFLTLAGRDDSNAHRARFVTEFKEEVRKFAKEGSSVLESGSKKNNKKIRAFKNNAYVSINKKTTVLDILQTINDGIKTSDKLGKYGKQLVAGKHDPLNVTKSTMLPFHMINRLITPLEELGLGLSKDYTTGIGNLTKNIALKRVLPIIGGAYALSYLNYESKKLTGTSMTGALSNAGSQLVLGTKTIIDATGYDEKARAASRYNPIAQYWAGDYKDREEYLDHLEYGYDPVRKGRFWSFGSTSEFRGGKVSYWKPTNSRIANSDAYDNSVYGSSDEKWKHSLIPTLRYPLSPIRALLDPYWLEKKHKDDRPYPLSAPMFEESTPWGGILNATIGNVLKPQIQMHKDVLQGTTTDVRNIIEARNARIKQASAERSLGRIDGQGLSTMAFNPYSMLGTEEARFSMQINNGEFVSGGFEGQQYAETLGSFGDIQLEGTPSMYPDDTIGPMTVGGQVTAGKTLRNEVKSSGIMQDINSTLSGAMLKIGQGISSTDAKMIIADLNKSIFTPTESKKSGIMNQTGNVHRTPITRYAEEAKNNYIESMVEDRSKNDYVKDMIYSGQQLSGIYGFLYGQVAPSSKSYEMENAGQMASFSRRFWDSSVGGIGGNFMEIARRFFPHEDHDVTMVNNIRNTMEDWLPGRFRVGDPYTKVPMGDLRLPGSGYETIKKLHSDKYGEYGAFDRYKILGDIAPLSEEYKTWRKIARQEIKHPFLVREMDKIDRRVKEQTKEHQFYDYKFLGKKLTDHKSYVQAVNDDGTFTVVGSNEIYKLAGIKLGKDANGMSNIHNVFTPGMEVNLKYEDNEYRNRNSAGQISTLAFVNGQSVTRTLYNKKLATEDYDKETLADELFTLNNSDMRKGHLFEAIAHAPIPYIHNKYLRIDSPLEAYNKEQVYGTAYSTWSHPIRGYLKPTFQEAWSRGPVAQAVGLGTLALSVHATKNVTDGTGRLLAHTAFALTNPGGFAGGLIGAIPRMNPGSHQSKIINSRNLSVVGALVGYGGYAVTHLENPFESMANFAAIGYALNDQFKFNSISGGKLGNGTAALIGAGVGLGLSALKNPEFSLHQLNEKWIPKDTRDKWEIEEYYDRLEYVKYMNLYSKASRIARRKEGVDVKRIVSNFEKRRDKNKGKIKDLEAQKEEAQKILNDQIREDLIANIDGQIAELETPEQYFQMGEYTKSALAYKKAAESTVYGLTEHSTNSDILRALPKYNRDFFLEFAKEKDPRARKKILKTLSPYQAKALKILWGEDPKEYEIEDNSEYFQNHALPNLVWRGWDSRVDLEKVKIKTIENEGMLLSDFGIYESQKDEPTYHDAPELESLFEDSSKEKTQIELTALLNGLGFTNVDISVDASQQSGIQVVTNLKREISYNISSALNSIF